MKMNEIILKKSDQIVKDNNPKAVILNKTYTLCKTHLKNNK